MSGLTRRALLQAAATAAWVPAQAAGLRFPQDFGAHPDVRVEWWYVTGTLAGGDRLHGFQLTFFRSRTGIAASHPSRFAARQLVFAHAAVTDLRQRRLRHDQRIARAGFGIAEAAEGDTDVRLRDWQLRREGAPERSRYHARAASDAAGFALDLQLDTTQAVLLQGDAGWSRKSPRPEVASRYYSQPQLAVGGRLTLDGQALDVTGRAWLDHECGEAMIDREAVGWDWIGMNLDDGSALMAFRHRRADGSTLWAGGSFRAAGGTVQDFAPTQVSFAPVRTWTSPASRAGYPVEWILTTPAGSFVVKALLDDQELDSRASTGTIYWEGLSDLLDRQGKRVGRGYLEMTGYAAPLRL